MSDQGQPAPPPPPPASGFAPPPPPPGAAAPPPFLGSPGGDERAARASANRVPGLVVIAGAVLLLVATFLPWAGLADGAADDLGFDGTASGWSTFDDEVGDGPIFAVFAVGLVVLGGLAAQGTVNLGTKIATLAVAALALLLAVAEWANIAADNADLEDLGVDAPFSYGVGLWLLILGAAVALIGAILVRRRPRTG